MRKKCSDCGRTLPAHKFYKRSPPKKGLTSKCRECTCADVRRRRVQDARAQEQDRERFKDRSGDLHRTHQWRQDHPEAYYAHGVVSSLIQRGKLHREPCKLCGSTEHIRKHWRDYSRPLDIVWLCAKCLSRIRVIFPELRESLGRSERAAP